MKTLLQRAMLITLVCFGLAACSTPRSADGDQADPTILAGAAPGEMSSTWAFDGVDVSLDRAQVYYAEGGRRAEEARIKLLMEDAVARGARGVMSGERPVRVRVDVLKFDALSPFERVVSGGMHTIETDLAIVDAATGEVLASEAEVDMSRIAWGGIAAAVATSIGRPQYVRITERVAQVSRDWIAAR